LISRLLQPCKPSVDPRNKGRPEGFTIVEVMMASVILVVGFMGMITALTISSEMLATARRQTLAAQIMSSEMDKLRLTTWTNLPAAGTSPLTIGSDFSSAVTASGLTTSTITLSRTVADLDVNSDGIVDFKDVKLTVQWTKSGTSTAAATPSGSWLDNLAFYRPSSISRTYTRSMSSVIGEYGLNLNIQR